MELVLRLQVSSTGTALYGTIDVTVAKALACHSFISRNEIFQDISDLIFIKDKVEAENSKMGL